MTPPHTRRSVWFSLQAIQQASCDYRCQAAAPHRGERAAERRPRQSARLQRHQSGAQQQERRAEEPSSCNVFHSAHRDGVDCAVTTRSQRAGRGRDVTDRNHFVGWQQGRVFVFVRRRGVGAEQRSDKLHAVEGRAVVCQRRARFNRQSPLPGGARPGLDSDAGRSPGQRGSGGGGGVDAPGGWAGRLIRAGQRTARGGWAGAREPVSA